jgi:hypothetical protein
LSLRCGVLLSILIITFECNTPPFRKQNLRFDVIVIADECRYRDGFDYRYDNLEESKNTL